MSLISLIAIFIILALIVVYIVRLIRKYEVSSINEFISALQQQSINRSIAKFKRERIRKKKKGLGTKYNTLIKSMLANLELSSTVEWFTYIVVGLCIIATIILFFVVNSLIISVFLVMALASAGISLLAALGTKKASVKLNAILDFLDLLCAYIDSGPTYAIEQNITSADPVIKHFFEEFIEERQHGVIFEDAIKRLNMKLGPAFDNFADKAIVYERERVDGMSKMFKDIIDDNAIIREINIKKKEAFDDMNKNFLYKFLIVGGFVSFIYLNNTGMRYFLSQTITGKGFASVCVIAVCLVFAYTQIQQLDLTFGGGKKHDSVTSNNSISNNSIYSNYK